MSTKGEERALDDPWSFGPTKIEWLEMTHEETYWLVRRLAHYLQQRFEWGIGWGTEIDEEGAVVSTIN